MGSTLVRAGLERADTRGAPLVTGLVDPAYYKRFGFEAASRHGIEPPGSDVPYGLFSVRRLSAYSDRFRGRIV